MSLDGYYKGFQIIWEDLTEDCQKRLLEALGIEDPKQAGFHKYQVTELNIGWGEGLGRQVRIINLDNWKIDEKISMNQKKKEKNIPSQMIFVFLLDNWMTTMPLQTFLKLMELWTELITKEIVKVHVSSFTFLPKKML